MNDEVCRQLDDYLLDELPDEQRAHFERHLRECETCRSISEQQAIIDEKVKSASLAAPVPEGLSVRARRHIETHRRRVTLSAICVAGAAGLLFAIWHFSGSAAGPSDRIVPPTITEQKPDKQPGNIPQEESPPEEIATHDPEPAVRISFSDNVLAVPVESGDPTITLYQVYPVAKTHSETQ